MMLFGRFVSQDGDIADSCIYRRTRRDGDMSFVGFRLPDIHIDDVRLVVVVDGGGSNSMPFHFGLHPLVPIVVIRGTRKCPRGGDDDLGGGFAIPALVIRRSFVFVVDVDVDVDDDDDPSALAKTSACIDPAAPPPIVDDHRREIDVDVGGKSSSSRTLSEFAHQRI